MGVRRYWFYWEYHIILLSILSLQWKGRNCEKQTEKQPGFKIEAPAEVTVQRGLCVLIPCNFIVGPGFTLTKDAIGIWYKGYNGHVNKIVAASTDSSQFPDTTNGRFIFTGKVSAGDCSFSISDAQSGDAAHYQFRFEDRNNLKFSFINIQPNVSVTDLKEPDISPTKNLIAGEEVTVTCTAPTHCPGLSPTFTWEGSVNTENTHNHTLRHQDGTVTYWSNITFTPSVRDNNSSLTCTVTYKHESAKKSIILNVEYAPRQPTICVDKLEGCSTSVCVLEGSTLSLNCSAKSNPPANFSWIQSDSFKKLSENKTLNVYVTNYIEYTCQAENKYGLSNSSIAINITHAQKFQIHFVVTGLCILFFTPVVITTVFIFRWMRKKKDLQEDRITKEMPKSDVYVIYNNIQSISKESYMDKEKAKQNKDDSDLYINYEKELQYASLDFSKIKPKEAPQKVDSIYPKNIIYSEVKCN